MPLRKKDRHHWAKAVACSCDIMTGSAKSHMHQHLRVLMLFKNAVPCMHVCGIDFYLHICRALTIVHVRQSWHQCCYDMSYIVAIKR